MTRRHSSRPHESIVPRPHTDAHQRYRTYGPLQPMEPPVGWRGKALLWLFWIGLAGAAGASFF